jgi:hypothetical protein
MRARHCDRNRRVTEFRREPSRSFDAGDVLEADLLVTQARYLLNLFAATLATHDPRRQALIAAVHADFQGLSAAW